MPQDTTSHFSASETLENQGLQEPEIELSGKDRTLAFELVNACTWKLTMGRVPWLGVATGAAATAPLEQWRGLWR